MEHLDHSQGSVAALSAPGDAVPASPLAEGAVVCVWNSFLQRWTGGFVVADVVAGGYRLRRSSDGHVFEDDVFPLHTVMRERRQLQAPGFESADLDRRRRAAPPSEPAGAPDRLAD